VAWASFFFFFFSPRPRSARSAGVTPPWPSGSARAVVCDRCGFESARRCFLRRAVDHLRDDAKGAGNFSRRNRAAARILAQLATAGDPSCASCGGTGPNFATMPRAEPRSFGAFNWESKTALRLVGPHYAISAEFFNWWRGLWLPVLRVPRPRPFPGPRARIFMIQRCKHKTTNVDPRSIGAVDAASKTANVFIGARYPIALSAAPRSGGSWAGRGRCLVPPSRRRDPGTPRSELRGNGAESRDDAPCRPPLNRCVLSRIENGGPIGWTSLRDRREVFWGDGGGMWSPVLRVPRPRPFPGPRARNFMTPECKQKTANVDPSPIGAVDRESKTANVFIGAHYPIALSVAPRSGGGRGLEGGCLVPPSRRRDPESPRSELRGNGAESRDDAQCRPPLIWRA